MAHCFAVDYVRFCMCACCCSGDKVVLFEDEFVFWHGELGLSWDEHGLWFAYGCIFGLAWIMFNVLVKLRGLTVCLVFDGSLGDVIVFCFGERLEVWL